MRTVIVCGSRYWTDEALILRVLQLVSPGGMTEKVRWKHGACPTGADMICDGLVSNVERFPADWARQGNSAGPKRNAAMAASGADLCVAFLKTGCANRGTNNMMIQARLAGIPVLAVDDNGFAEVWHSARESTVYVRAADLPKACREAIGLIGRRT